MTMIAELTTYEAQEQAQATPVRPSADLHCIKRKGARPLRFDGTELAMSMSFVPEFPYWYEINMYRTTDYRYVVAIRLFHQSSESVDTVVASEHDSVDAAVQFIMTYDAAQDVQVPLHLDTMAENPASLAAASLDIMSRIHEMRMHYRNLVGEFLYEFEAAT